MIHQVDAIYDNGVLRPLAPLALPNQARVKLTVDAGVSVGKDAELEREGFPPLASDVLAKQQAALEELRRTIDHLTSTKNNDGWSVRQHDELLYGGKK